MGWPERSIECFGRRFERSCASNRSIYCSLFFCKRRCKAHGESGMPKCAAYEAAAPYFNLVRAALVGRSPAGGDRQSAGMKRSAPARRVGLPVSFV